MRGRARLAWAIAVLISLAIGGCGSSQPKSAYTAAELKAAVKGAPEPLARLYARGGELVDGDPAAYKRQIAALHGYPIVVNKWASWCGPCKLEFPIFQEVVARQGKKVAFLGVDVQDVREDAEEFLKETPVPYPSFFDPRGKIAELLPAATDGLPTTSFYDREGTLVYTKPGPYATRAALEKDLAQHAGAPVS